MATNFNLTSYTPPSGNVVNFSFGTGAQTVNVDLERQVVSTEIISTDTLRQIIAGIAQTINTDTSRQIVASESIQVDARRLILVAETVGIDTLRKTTISKTVLTDTSRQVVTTQTHVVNLDTKREVAIIPQQSTSVSEAYKAAIKADTRHIVPLVYIYFDGLTQPPTMFVGDVVSDISLLEETSADSSNPLGSVSANELTVSLDNSLRYFTPTNTESPYYGKLKPNTLIKPYLGVVLPDDSNEYVALGVFKSGDWSSPSSSLESSVTAYDKLYEIGELDVPMLAMADNVTIGQLFEILFVGIGMSTDDYYIDTALTQVVQLGYISKGKVKAALQYLSVAGFCSVYTDRYGVIQVKSNFMSGTPITTWTDNDQIINAENPQKYLDAYSVVRLSYKLPTKKALSTVLSITSYVIPAGGTTITAAEFSSGPIFYVEQVRLLGAINSVVANIEYGAWSITIGINNAGANETVDIEVIGKSIDFTAFNYSVEDTNAINMFGSKELQIDNNLIQSLNVATSYAQSLLAYVSDPLVNFEVELRGDPAIKVNDIVRIQDEADKIGTVDAVITRIELDFDGGLSANVKARVPISEV